MPSYKLTYFNGRGRGELSRLLFAAAGVEFEDERIEMQDWPKVKPGVMLTYLLNRRIDDQTLFADRLGLLKSLTINFSLQINIGISSHESQGDLSAVEYQLLISHSDVQETPQGSMPVLEIDGKVKMCQSLSIARYLAREFSLYGKTNMDAVIIDQILDTCLDLFTPFISIMFQPKDEQEGKIKEFYEKTGEKVLGFIKDLMKQSGKNGFAVGDGLTVADLYIFVCIEAVVEPMVASLKDDKLLEKFTEIAAVKKNVESLPRLKAYLDKRPATQF